MSDGNASLAERCTAAMMKVDNASRGLGMVVASVSAGRAEMTMPVIAAMTNGHGNCHGGFIFALADSAFGYACNAYNQRAVAQHCNITYVRPAKLGDTLRAVAMERSRSGRSGIYDVTVSREDGTVIAELRGHSRTVDGSVI